MSLIHRHDLVFLVAATVPPFPLADPVTGITVLRGECSRKMTVISHPSGVLVVPLEQLSEPQKQRNRSQTVGLNNESFIAAYTY